MIPTNIIKALFFIVVLAVLWLSVFTGQEALISTGWDKSNHLLAFFVLALLADHGYPKLPWWKVKFALLLGYGLLIEVMQYFTPNRLFSLLDLFADGLGLVLYFVVALIIHKRLGKN